MDILAVNNLCKNYESFALKNVSFKVKQGEIMGFIGRNGAGKTTTLKSILNFVHPDSGEIIFFEKDFSQNEFEIKQKIGFVSGGFDCYTKTKIRVISGVTKKFYPNWNEEAYKKYMKKFNLDENKTPDELSAGMKVKYSLALALSHNAELLILDEPTSGLDPVSRDDLLDVFLQLADNGVSILFSTHITSDLDKCANSITYIKNGEIIACENTDSFVAKYRVVTVSKTELDNIKPFIVGSRRNKDGYTALIKEENINNIPANLLIENADLEAIMVHMEKED